MAKEMRRLRRGLLSLAVSRHGGSDATTLLEFTIDPGLSTGDRIVLQSNVACRTSCRDEQLAMVTGVLSFNNSGTRQIPPVLKSRRVGGPRADG